MTYVLFINGIFFDSTRDNSQAFAWMKEWQDIGYSAGLKFLRDDDDESRRWLIPQETFEKMKRVAA
jgi:hypothetical protein